MEKLVQIIYISRSTSPPGRPENGVDPVVARILAKSRVNNRKNGLVGVLYFGNGCFFQCLEGEESVVDKLYATLQQDPRHEDLKIISRKAIAAPSFKDWSMKYVPTEQSMAKLLQAQGISSFDPYQFNDATIQSVIALLLRATEPADVPLPAVPSAPTPQAVPTREKTKSSSTGLVVGVVVLLVVGALLFWGLAT